MFENRYRSHRAGDRRFVPQRLAAPSPEPLTRPEHERRRRLLEAQARLPLIR